MLVPQRKGLELQVEPRGTGGNPHPDQIHPQVQIEVSVSDLLQLKGDHLSNTTQVDQQ